MAASGPCFVEWKEQFVSKDRGNRVVHYYLKDISGESILAVVGTERSVRHMLYVVSEEFLNVLGAENSVHVGYRWRSRREVVNWLTSMLSKLHQHSKYSESLEDDPIFGRSAQQGLLPDCKGRLPRNLRGHASDIMWSGVAWSCGKQLKHYPAFCRNGITIAIQSFVFVMAEGENRYLAYLEDMYEDRKGQKKVKVRWFHHNREVKGVLSIRNSHPKEVFITPYAQVISVECVDGPAIVVTREHYEKFVALLPQDLLDRVHICFRQFKSNCVKPFKLSKLRGYFNQPIFSCLDPDLFEADDFSSQDNVKLRSKRIRGFRGRQLMTFEQSGRNLKYGTLRRLICSNYVKCTPLDTPFFKAGEKIELLCQDSGIRGCWFRCTVLQVSRKQLKVKYDDLMDGDGCGNTEEWIPAFRSAIPDKLGIRYPGRPTIRPALPHDDMNIALEVGDPVDAWWSDGWWEGVITEIGDSGDGNMQVYVPSESIFLHIDRKNLRVSRDWVGGQWVAIERNLSIISTISAFVSPNTKVSVASSIDVEAKSGDFPISYHEVLTDTKLKIVEEDKIDLVCSGPGDGKCVNEEDDRESNDNHIRNCHGESVADCIHDNTDYDGDDINENTGDPVEYGNADKLEIGESEMAGQDSKPEVMETVT